MPLDDTAWARGKCAFKLLTYMACGIPVVASPVGMNSEVLDAGGGAAPRSKSDWVDALIRAVSDPSWRKAASQKGRSAVLQNYSVGVLAPRFAGLLRSVC